MFGGKFYFSLAELTASSFEFYETFLLRKERLQQPNMNLTMSKVVRYQSVKSGSHGSRRMRTIFDEHCWYYSFTLVHIREKDLSYPWLPPVPDSLWVCRSNPTIRVKITER